MRKTIGAAAFAGSLLAGGAIGAAFIAPDLATAQEEAPDTTPLTTWVDDALSGLVDDEVITAEQADAVAGALEDARPERPDRGGFGHFRGGPGGSLGSVSEILGIEQADLFEALQDGATLGEIATQNDSSPQALIDALVANVSDRLDDAVADGRIDQAEADEKLTEATDRITDLVNGELPPPGEGGGFGRFGGPRFGPEDPDAESDVEGAIGA